MEDPIVKFLTSFVSSIGWVGIILIMALESANIPIPSEVTMPLAGAILVHGSGGTALQAILLGGIFGALGCLIGSTVNYGVGAYGGRPFVERFGKYIFINAKDIDRADKWFKRWGDWAAFISRLLPVVRTFISFPAGITRVNFPRFAILTFLGSFIWCALLSLAGFIVWDHIESIRNVMRPFDLPIVVILLIGIAYYIYRHIRHGRAEANSVETV